MLFNLQLLAPVLIRLHSLFISEDGAIHCFFEALRPLFGAQRAFKQRSCKLPVVLRGLALAG